jgi:hypothetical protein
MGWSVPVEGWRDGGLGAGRGPLDSWGVTVTVGDGQPAADAAYLGTDRAPSVSPPRSLVGRRSRLRNAEASPDGAASSCHGDALSGGAVQHGEMGGDQHGANSVWSARSIQ